MNSQGKLLASPGVVLGDSWAAISAGAASTEWIVYCAGNVVDLGGTQSVHLTLTERNGTAWIALPDYRSATWQWQKLPEGLAVELQFWPEKNLRNDGALLIALVANDNARLVVTRLAVDGCSGSEPDDPAVDPVVDAPETIGVYLSQGYWDLELAEQTFSQLEQCSVNFAIDYALILPEDAYWVSAFDEYLACAQRHGVGLGFNLQPLLAGMTGATADGHIADAAAAVGQLKDEPAVTAWYVHDEVLPSVAEDPASACYWLTLTQMQQLYQAIAQADPSRPQLSVWCMLPEFANFQWCYQPCDPDNVPDWCSDPVLYEQALKDTLRTTCDVVMVDCYPVDPPWDAGGLTPEQAVASLTLRAAELKAPEQPLWFVLQAFSWQQYFPEHQASFPTPEQLRDMLGTARACGAGNVVAYSWFDLAESTQRTCDVAGRPAAMANLQDCLAQLNTTGWPEYTAPMATVLGGSPPYLQLSHTH